MSNKDFEEKVLKALGNMQEDITGLKTDVSGLKTDVSGLKEGFVKLGKKIDNVESNLNTKIDGVESSLTKKIDNVESNLNTKIDGVESSLTKKIDLVDSKLDKQTYELKQEMRLNTAYIEQAFKYMSEIDKKNYMEKYNVEYA